MELIDRAALLNRVPKCDMEMHVMDVKRLINRQPAVAAAPVVHARWIDEGECSHCGYDYHEVMDGDSWSSGHVPKYCGGCGAHMDAPAREGEDSR